MTGSLHVINFADILVHIIKEKIRFIKMDLKVVYNENHMKHFKMLPWWCKSNTFAEFTSIMKSNLVHSVEKDSTIIEPIQKKRRLSNINDNCENDDFLHQYDPLAEFCENVQNKIMEVHRSSELLEKRLKDHQLQNQKLEEKINNAIFNKDNFLTT